MRQGGLHGAFAVAGGGARRPAEDPERVRQCLILNLARAHFHRPAARTHIVDPLRIQAPLLLDAERRVQDIQHRLGHQRADVAPREVVLIQLVRLV